MIAVEIWTTEILTLPCACAILAADHHGPTVTSTFSSVAEEKDSFDVEYLRSAFLKRQVLFGAQPTRMKLQLTVLSYNTLPLCLFSFRDSERFVGRSSLWT